MLQGGGWGGAPGAGRSAESCNGSKAVAWEALGLRVGVPVGNPPMAPFGVRGVRGGRGSCCVLLEACEMLDSLLGTPASRGVLGRIWPRGDLGMARGERPSTGLGGLGERAAAEGVRGWGL